ncbi:sugar kinase [Thermoanaerobacteraceae bacterium SP2]|nr:sugar kinase [Thermoanaerobacteraceae bacterium SP2]
MYILSVDFGTSSVKSAILDEKFNIVASSKVEYNFNIKDSDKIELDPDVVFEAFVQCIHKFQNYSSKVELIAFDIFSPSVLFMDENGKALYPIITHLDRRSRRQTEQILDVMGEDEFQKITGVLPFTGGVSVTTILWMKENMPDIYNNSYKIGHFNTYFYKKLTGIWAIDPVNASQMGLFETVKSQNWSKDICNTFDININKLPDIMYAGTIAGNLCKEVANLTGLREGIPVALGSNDAATAHIGADNFNPGDVLDISGSNEILTILTDKPIMNKKYYLRNAVTPGLWQIFAISTGGFAVDWFRQEFCKDMDKDEFYNKYIVEIVQNIKKTTVEFLPYLAGDRHSLEKKRGGFTGLTLDTKREDMLMSILIGMHNPIIETFDLASKFLNLNKTIKLTGGLTGGAYIQLKKMLFKGYNFKIVQDCPLIGNAKLALKALNDSL